jgi:Flp pilus assembly protein TadD
MPWIARATAVSLLERYLSQQSLPTIERSLASTDPLLRSAAVEILSLVDPPSRLALGYPLLNDPIRQVRLEAARVLTSVADQMSAAQRSTLDRALEEYRAAQMVNADRPGYHLNLSVIDQQLGDLESAERSLRTALSLDPSFAPAYVNLADVFRLKGQDAEGERVLRDGLSVAPDDASLYHALGLLLARGQRQEEAVDALGRAAALQPENARYGYVYGVALHSAGETDRALEVLDASHRREPANRELLIALATISRENGDATRAVEYGRKLVALSPQDPAARELLEQLQR